MPVVSSCQVNFIKTLVGHLAITPRVGPNQEPGEAVSLQFAFRLQSEHRRVSTARFTRAVARLASL